MDQLLADIHKERVAYDGYGPWAVIRKDDVVAAYRVERNFVNGTSGATVIEATLMAEAEFAEIEGDGHTAISEELEED